MARLNIINGEKTTVEVLLSRRNLLTLLQKLEMRGSYCGITNNDTFEDGEPTTGVELVLIAEEDEPHYARRELGPGEMHPTTEMVIQAQGAKPPTEIILRLPSVRQG
jgi:hypothetical protein